MRLKTITYITAAVVCICVLCIIRAANNFDKNNDDQEIKTDAVEKFVFFIGYSRSGHSAIASIMDAHPEMIIAHEFRVFERLDQKDSSVATSSRLYTMLYHNSHRAREGKGYRSKQQDRKGYNLHLPDESWQGRFRALRVIGDKAGGNTVDVFIRNATHFAELYHKLVGIVNVPIHAIHVVRNPFDMVATDVLFSASNNYMTKLNNVSEERKFANQRMIKNRANILFRRATAIAEMIKTYSLNVLEIHLEDFIEDPRGKISKVCTFLQLDCGEDYLKICQEKAYKLPSHSSKLIEWSQLLKGYMHSKMKYYPWFERYL